MSSTSNTPVGSQKSKKDTPMASGESTSGNGLSTAVLSNTSKEFASGIENLSLESQSREKREYDPDWQQEPKADRIAKSKGETIVSSIDSSKAKGMGKSLKESEFIGKTFRDGWGQQLVYSRSFHDTLAKLPYLELPSVQATKLHHFKAITKPELCFNVPRRLIEEVLLEGTVKDALFVEPVPEPRTVEQVTKENQTETEGNIVDGLDVSAEGEVDGINMTSIQIDLDSLGLKDLQAHRAYYALVTEMRDDCGLSSVLECYEEQAFKEFPQMLKKRLAHLEGLGLNENSPIMKDTLVTIEYLKLGCIYLEGDKTWGNMKEAEGLSKAKADEPVEDAPDGRRRPQYLRGSQAVYEWILQGAESDAHWVPPSVEGGPEKWSYM